MKRNWFAALYLAFVSLAVIGCGGSAEAPPASIPAQGQPAPASATSPQGGAQVEPPDAIVTAFLESLRKGNDAVAASLLTERARYETQAKGMKVQPPGTPDMTYQIGQTEYVTETNDGAHVGSIWTEKFETGETHSFEVIWVMRLEAQGWRIAGMAMPVGEGEEPLFLNFEDPEDLLRKWHESEAEVAEAQSQLPGAETDQPAIENAAFDANGNPIR